MKCEVCNRNSADERLCRVCGEAVDRVLRIAQEAKRTQVSPAPGKPNGAAATAGR